MTPGNISNIHRGIVSLYINSASTPPGVSHYSRLNNVCALTHKIDNDNYPCLCLCFGFSQITLMLPFLLMILHFSQIGLTDDLTFTSNPPFIHCFASVSYTHLDVYKRQTIIRPTVLAAFVKIFIRPLAYTF